MLLDADGTTSTSQWWHAIEGAAHVPNVEPQQGLVRTADEPREVQARSLRLVYSCDEEVAEIRRHDRPRCRRTAVSS